MTVSSLYKSLAQTDPDRLIHGNDSSCESHIVHLKKLVPNERIGDRSATKPEGGS